MNTTKFKSVELKADRWPAKKRRPIWPKKFFWVFHAVMTWECFFPNYANNPEPDFPQEWVSNYSVVNVWIIWTMLMLAWRVFGRKLFFWRNGLSGKFCEVFDVQRAIFVTGWWQRIKLDQKKPTAFLTFIRFCNAKGYNILEHYKKHHKSNKKIVEN